MRWTLKEKPDVNIIRKLQEELGVSHIVAHLLVQRKIYNFEEAKNFFRPQLDQLHDPFLMKGMEIAVNRIEQAIQKQEKILVYGDYDVDGTTSVALMHSYLQEQTTLVSRYIPDRYKEGYGLSYQGIDFAFDNEFSLIITLDCGIKAVEKVAYAKTKNIDIIICDHHRPGNIIPDAYAVLDPKQTDCNYPYKELCGCGVGFKLIQAIEQHKNRGFSNLYNYLDLVAVAIAADIVPITGENRILAYYGIKMLNTKPREGFQALLKSQKKENYNITDVVFGLAPKINAAGRIEHALYAVDLLEETNEEQALSKAEKIEHFNEYRKTQDRRITEEALSQIEKFKEQKNYTTVVYQEDWHKGVIGIVASRLTETYYRPTLVFTKSGEKLAASARSVKGFDVYNALEACDDYIEQFGGHKYAAGLTLEEKNYLLFKNKFEKVVKANILEEQRTPEIAIDILLDFNEINNKLMRILKQFAPFGPGNMSPVFCTKNVYDTGFAKAVGKDKSHLKCEFAQEGSAVKFHAIGFGMADKLALLSDAKQVAIVYALEENHWQGNTSLQLKLKDIRPI
ncbi:single-stranded-DNA-specific exonuclease [Mesonia hippocampi]|uniref:Single-stranded-DNA-specific exonuclease RecJ n=1 Tax=Mesonia hippocampi TaxID=1628250 RepID=A0A840EPI4_9FLAO|nr:single-stranded-DNA-specific exonuclease RecJ [Mesonia hippocampi]MBB4118513.1 single-stranded-DNA-specific exonuclease [Mesonia hippocampi]